MKISLFLISLLAILLMGSAVANVCVTCHTDITPGIVTDWKLSKHAENDVVCANCHGDAHTSADDVDEVLIPTPETCASCHMEKFTQFSKGKHAKAWTAMKSMPTAHWQPMGLVGGMKDCGACHKIGLKSKEEIKQLKSEGSGFGMASCDACHTRHLFSKAEARQPQACRTCHMGNDHPQWEMYSASKHGVRNDLKQKGIIHENSSAPTCQTCHMPEGDHEVRTAWGFLGIRLPLPEDKQWREDSELIMQALGIIDPDGNLTSRVDDIKNADVARLTQEDFDHERNKMIKICSDCHSENFAKAELAKGDEMIKSADHLLAQGIRIVADLYQDNILVKPESYAQATTTIEQTLFEMHLKHRNRAFQGAFHSNPDYALWYGWSEMQRDLTEIKEKAAELRKAKAEELEEQNEDEGK